MLTRTSSRVVLVLLAVVASGCTTHKQLRRNTINQAQTLSEVHQQQVLNNLAKFVYDPHALPDFAWPNAGSTNVVDQGSGSFSLSWIASGFEGAGLGGGGSRSATDSWTLTPINDPRKLELMRCAYQRAVEMCGGGIESSSCPDCIKRQAKFYLGKVPENQEGGPLNPGELGEKLRAQRDKIGIVNSECLYGPCWFNVCCPKCLPEHCDRKYMGTYCGVSIYVPPEGRDALTKLTLAILDYAINEPPQPRQKKVEFTYKRSEETGQLEVVEKVVAGNVDFDADDDSIRSQELRKAELRKAIERKWNSRGLSLNNVRKGLSGQWNTNQLEDIGLNNKEDILEFSADRNRLEALESANQDQFYPPQRSPVPGAGYLQFNQNLRALTP